MDSRFFWEGRKEKERGRSEFVVDWGAVYFLFLGSFEGLVVVRVVVFFLD